jgi:DNA-binding IclR family transcriptional regulator
MEPLTAKQQKVLRFIEKRLEADRPPSQREVAERFDLAQNAAYQIIGYLKNKGYLTDLGGHRGLRLSSRSSGRWPRASRYWHKRISKDT